MILGGPSTLPPSTTLHNTATDTRVNVVDITIYAQVVHSLYTLVYCRQLGLGGKQELCMLYGKENMIMMHACDAAANDDGDNDNDNENNE